MALETMLSARSFLETTRGTGGTPTRIVYFDQGTHDQKVQTIIPTEKRATYRPNFRAYPGIERNTLNFAGDWTYDQSILWLNLGVKAVASGTGGGADKTWTFLPTSTSDDLKSANFQFGYSDSIGATRPAWSLEGCMVDELKLSWRKDQTVQFAAKVMSAEAATQISAFTGALSDVVTTSALGTGTTVTIDTTTIGTTADSDVMDVDFTLNNGFTYLDTLNGTAVASEILRPNPVTWSLDFTRYYRNDTEMDLNLLKTPRKIRVKSMVGAGTSYAMTLDCYGVYDGDSYEKTVVDGLGVEKYKLVPYYDATATADFQFVIINQSGTIT